MGKFFYRIFISWITHLCGLSVNSWFLEKWTSLFIYVSPKKNLHFSNLVNTNNLYIYRKLSIRNVLVYNAWSLSLFRICTSISWQMSVSDFIIPSYKSLATPLNVRIKRDRENDGFKVVNKYCRMFPYSGLEFWIYIFSFIALHYNYSNTSSTIVVNDDLLYCLEIYRK